MNYTSLRWWLIFCMSLISSFIIHYKGLFLALWHADISGISFIIIITYFIITIFIGHLTNKLTRSTPESNEFHNSSVYLQGCWYGSELLMALGMIGTLVGFTLMLGPALAGLDFGNILAAKAGIFKMASGMSTAVLTTLTGLITSQLVKLQLINIETTINKK